MKLDPSADQQEHEILTACALRFDGYKYMEATRWDYDNALRKALRTRSLPSSSHEKQALFFILQRKMFKYGGDRLPQSDRHWQLFRSLFLEVWNLPVPSEYAPDPHNDFGWPNKFDVAQSLALIQTIHKTTKYDLSRSSHRKPN